jgi:hypothetical protein
VDGFGNAANFLKLCRTIRHNMRWSPVVARVEVKEETRDLAIPCNTVLAYQPAAAARDSHVSLDVRKEP